MEELTLCVAGLLLLLRKYIFFLVEAGGAGGDLQPGLALGRGGRSGCGSCLGRLGRGGVAAQWRGARH